MTEEQRTMPVRSEGELVYKPLKLHRGVWCREETYDSYVVNEIERSYGQLRVRGHVVFDVGGNIGAFSRWAIDRGAAHVVAYEPEPLNFAMLELNVGRDEDATVVNAALTSGPPSKSTLYLSTSGKNPGNSSTTPFRGREAIDIQTANFREELDKYKPTVIKMDCEGAEYDLLLGDDLPNHVEEIVVELHLSKKEWPALAKQVEARFADWEIVKAPVLSNSKLWHTIGQWRR